MANWLEYLITLQIFDLAVFNFCPALNMPFLRTKQEEGGECMSPCKRPKGSIQSELLHVTLTMATIYDEALVERVQDLLTSKSTCSTINSVLTRRVEHIGIAVR